MRYLVKVDELSQKIEYLENQLLIIDENIEFLKNIKLNIIWEGEAYLTFVNNYDNYLDELDIIKKNILSYIDYLKLFYNNYENEFLKLRQKYVDLSNER